MTKLRALTREKGLRGYSKLRKAELIAFLQDDGNRTCRQPQQPEPSMGPSGAPQQQQPQQQPLTKRQCKLRCAKDTKLVKCFINLNTEINALKLQMEGLKEKIS